MAGVTTEACIAPPAISAAEEGDEVLTIVDASGSRSTLTDEIAFRRMERYSVELTATAAVIAELASDWSTDHRTKLMNIVGQEILN